LYTYPVIGYNDSNHFARKVNPLMIENKEEHQLPQDKMNISSRLWRNIRDLPSALTPQTITAGLVGVVIAYTGPLVIVFQAAGNAGLDRAHLSSWIMALTVGSGITGLMLCLWYRQPVVVAWSIAGSALLLTTIKNYTPGELIGSYLLAGLSTVILGWSGLFRRMLQLVPQTVIMGMLAGLLLRFGIDLFRFLPQKPFIVLSMLLVYLLLRRRNFKAPTVVALGVGLLVAAISGDLRYGTILPELAVPVLQFPEFTLSSALSLALPLFILSITSQTAPGFAVLRAAGFETPVNGPVVVTGLASILTAPFGGHGLNLAALMTVICTSPEAHHDPDKRYGAGVAAGLFFILFGAFGATAVTLFAGLPQALIAAIAGLAMAGSITTSLAGAMSEPRQRDAALFALLVTASDITLLGIGAPFWGLVAGVLTSRLLKA
jgi:benzoate membrane transport protein